MEKVALGWAEEGITSVQEAKNSTNLYHKKYYSVLNARHQGPRTGAYGEGIYRPLDGHLPFYAGYH